MHTRGEDTGAKESLKQRGKSGGGNVTDQEDTQLF